MFCFENYSTKNLDYSNNKRSEQFLKQNTFCNLLLEVFTTLICTVYIAHGTNQNGNTWDVKTYANKLKNTIFRSMPPSFDGKIEKSFARAKKWERKKNMELMMSGFNSIFWHRTDFPGSFFKSEQFRTFFFSSLQQNGVKIISEGSYNLKQYFSTRIISKTFITYTGYHFIEVRRFLKKFALHYLFSHFSYK